MNFIDRLEKKFPRFGLPDLMRYVVIVNAIGFVLNMLAPNLYYRYLALDMYEVLHGQIWRLITFVLYPSAFGVGTASLMTVLLFALWMYVYYSIGISLERIWGTFRFNLFYFGGILFVILMSFASYFIMRVVMPEIPPQLLGNYLEQGVTLEHLNDSLFLAFALMFPNAQFLIYFVVPVKAKWLAIVWLVLDGFYVVQGIMAGDYFTVVMVIGALLNVALFLVFARGKPGVQGAYRQKKRRVQYKKKVREAAPGGTIHRCAICGRTEKDAPDLEFRYCSKCDGNYEYCSDHLFTHEHVHH